MGPLITQWARTVKVAVMGATVEGATFGIGLLRHCRIRSTGTTRPGHHSIGTPNLHRTTVLHGATTTTTTISNPMEMADDKEVAIIGTGMPAVTTHGSRAMVPTETMVASHAIILQKTRQGQTVTVSALRLGTTRNKVKK